MGGGMASREERRRMLENIENFLRIDNKPMERRPQKRTRHYDA
jgi:hypothetical protein